MAGWSLVVLVFAAAGTSVFADPRLAFPEALRDSRIVSGWEADEGQIPFQLSLRMVSPAGGVSSCGGTIIHTNWGLTAAHCSAGRVTLVIRAGTVNLTRPSAIFETSKYFNHPLYNEAMQGVVQPNDIGLIDFGRALTFGDLIKPIRLQRSEAKDRNYGDVVLTASGWGRTWTDAGSSETLNWVFLNGTTNEECRQAFGGSAIVQPSTICARWHNVTSQSTCSGDSGGPLVATDDDGQITQVGVTSFVSATGCHTGFPAGFIRPGYYLDWFQEITGIGFDWVYEVVTEEPTTEITATEEPTTEEPTTEEPTTEEPTTEEPTTKEPTTEPEEDSSSSSSSEEDSSSSSSSEEDSSSSSSSEEDSSSSSSSEEDSSSSSSSEEDK